MVIGDRPFGEEHGLDEVRKLGPHDGVRALMSYEVSESLLYPSATLEPSREAQSSTVKERTLRRDQPCARILGFLFSEL